jgi:integrase
MVTHALTAAARSVGITRPIGWHTFRRTFSTLTKSRGVDAKVVQELLRHASFAVSIDAYAQALNADKRDAQQRVIILIIQNGKVGQA